MSQKTSGKRQSSGHRAGDSLHNSRASLPFTLPTLQQISPDFARSIIYVFLIKKVGLGETDTAPTRSSSSSEGPSADRSMNTLPFGPGKLPLPSLSLSWRPSATSAASLATMLATEPANLEACDSEQKATCELSSTFRLAHAYGVDARLAEIG